MIKSVCVFCGAAEGVDPAYAHMAKRLGQLLGERGLRVVYGGATIGLMGVLANAALAAGSEVIGVIPQALLEREVAHHGLTELKVVHSMMDRKKLMFKESDAFILLPGGLGSLDEFFEALTILQLGFHQKPCAILDVNHYYKQLCDMLDTMVKEHFVKQPHRDMIFYSDDPSILLQQLSEFEMPAPRLS